MIVKAMNHLNTDVRKQVVGLAKLCNQHDGTHGEVKLDNSIQYFPEMNNLFLAYDGDQLVGAVKLFAIFKSSVELTGLTHPDFRGKGVFKSLMSEVYREVRHYGFEEVLYVIDTNSIHGLDWAERKHLAYQHTEVSMRLVNYSSLKKHDSDVFLKKVEPIELPVVISLHQELFGMDREAAEKYLRKVMNFNDKEFYFLSTSDHLIGLGGIYREEEKGVLFGIGIREPFRGKGYSNKLIRALVNLARKSGMYDIALEVDENNHRAYRLYKNIGFVEDFSVGYYREIL